MQKNRDTHALVFQIRHAARGVALLLALLASGAHAEAPQPPTGRSRVVSAVVIGAVGLALGGGYTTAAVLTGDRPSGFGLALAGGSVAGAFLGAELGVFLNSQRREATSLTRYVLLPVLLGLAGALVGGTLGAFGGFNPGPARTVTHVAVVSLIGLETLLFEIVR